MARPQIVLSLDAERDLDGLFDWIARDSGVDRAEAILRRIAETLELVAAYPASAAFAATSTASPAPSPSGLG